MFEQMLYSAVMLLCSLSQPLACLQKLADKPYMCRSIAPAEDVVAASHTPILQQSMRQQQPRKAMPEPHAPP